MTNEFDNKDMQEVFAKLKASWGWLMLFGLISLIGGFLSFSNPLEATVTVDYLVAFFFMLLGAVQIVQAFSNRGWGGFLWTLATGVLMIVVGGVLASNPTAGAASLTVLVAILLFLLGGSKIAYSFSMRPVAGWIWVLVSGVMSLVLGGLIVADFPWAATSVLGLFLGVELTFNGVTLLLTGWALRNS